MLDRHDGASVVAGGGGCSAVTGRGGRASVVSDALCLIQVGRGHQGDISTLVERRVTTVVDDLDRGVGTVGSALERGQVKLEARVAGVGH